MEALIFLIACLVIIVAIDTAQKRRSYLNLNK